MGKFLQVLKEEKEMRFIYAVFTVMILIGIGCVVFAITHPSG